MRKKSQFIRAILERSSLAMAMMAVLVVVGILLSGTPTASGQAIPANTPATGAPNIIGTAQASETLTVETSGIADGDGRNNVAFYYQWISNDGTTHVDIADETNSTYVIKPWDLGNHIKVRVSFTDNWGNQETLTSAATAAVEASPNEAATGGPIIDGMAEVGQSLGIVSLFGNGWIVEHPGTAMAWYMPRPATSGFAATEQQTPTSLTRPDRPTLSRMMMKARRSKCGCRLQTTGPTMRR